MIDASIPNPASPRSLSGLLPFLRPYKLQITLAFTLLVLAAASTLVFPIALRYLIDGGLVNNNKDEQLSALRNHFIVMFGVAFALGCFSAGRFFMVSWLGERVTADLRNAVYSHVLEQSPEFFESTKTGEVLSRLTVDTTLVQTVVGSSLSMGLRNSVMGLGALIMLIWTNPYVMIQVLGLLVLIVIPAVVFGRRVRRLSRASQDRLADTSAMAGEVLNAISVVQSYTAEKRESDRYSDATQSAFNTAIGRSKARTILVAFIIIATSGALLWGLYQGTQAVIGGRISAGDLGQTIVYILILAGAFAVLGEVYGDLLRAAGATERLMELLKTKSPVKSPTNPITKPTPKSGSTLDLSLVSFSYPSRPSQIAIKNFSINIKAGQTLAIVGSSGSGKTTLFNLLLRFYDPTEGVIKLDGLNLQEMTLHDLRQRIGIVPQDAIIFSTTAMDNIRYGDPASSDEMVISAAKAAFADSFITSLPDGYNTYLGERGVRLSGGQRQRIAIARAILKNPPLLLLDEATSALDSESERVVQAALESAMRDRTTLVIAHRLATIQKADLILVLDNGVLVEQGTHQELITYDGVYAHLANLQFNK